MNIFHKPNSESSTESVLIRSGNGSRAWGCGMILEDPQQKPSAPDTSSSGQARNPEHSFTFGTQIEQPAYSMGCIIHGSFTIQTTGTIGHEILNCDGDLIAWTTDPWIAQVICKLLSENEGLLGNPSRPSGE